MKLVVDRGAEEETIEGSRRKIKSEMLKSYREFRASSEGEMVLKIEKDTLEEGQYD